MPVCLDICYFYYFPKCDFWYVDQTHLPFSDFGEKLKEHRIEGAMSVVMCLVGLILGAIAFKSSVAKKWFAVFGMTAMLLSGEAINPFTPQTRKNVLKQCTS